MVGSLDCTFGQYVKGYARAPAATLFEDFCRRLAVAGVALWRAFVGMRTLHPQRAGYAFTWWRDRDLVQPVRRVRGEEYDQDLRDSPFLYLLNAAGTRDLPLRMRRRLAVAEALPDSGIGFSFATDHPEGFSNDDLRLIEAVLPAVSLAIVSDAEHTIAAGLLAAYLGCDAGRRVHAGVVERGSVESIRAVLWYARSYFRVMVRWSC
jgi:adenylate cyclase